MKGQDAKFSKWLKKCFKEGSLRRAHKHLFTFCDQNLFFGFLKNFNWFCDHNFFVRNFLRQIKMIHFGKLKRTNPGLSQKDGRLPHQTLLCSTRWERRAFRILHVLAKYMHTIPNGVLHTRDHRHAIAQTRTDARQGMRVPKAMFADAIQGTRVPNILATNLHQISLSI